MPVLYAYMNKKKAAKAAVVRRTTIVRTVTENRFMVWALNRDGGLGGRGDIPGDGNSRNVNNPIIPATNQHPKPEGKSHRIRSASVVVCGLAGIGKFTKNPVTRSLAK